jgi:hypothetical protein
VPMIDLTLRKGGRHQKSRRNVANDEGEKDLPAIYNALMKCHSNLIYIIKVKMLYEELKDDKGKCGHLHLDD